MRGQSDCRPSSVQSYSLTSASISGRMSGMASMAAISASTGWPLYCWAIGQPRPSPRSVTTPSTTGTTPAPTGMTAPGEPKVARWRKSSSSSPGWYSP
ncbi:MAG TPA: hypothetical protein PKA95_05620 [Thermomicrobiales bacterium]|nr:hypothetical protein [Thermomicrobiales bacterium]